MGYRYLGNKTRLLPWLLDILSKFGSPGDAIADPMCGTGAVSAALRDAGYRVFASDILSFCVTHAHVRLKIGKSPDFASVPSGPTYERALATLQMADPIQGYFHREFSPAGQPQAGVPPRQYFSAENAGRIDAMRRIIEDWSQGGFISVDERQLLLHDLVLAVNRVANIAGTYGHFRSSLSGAALKSLKLSPSQFSSRNVDGHRVALGRIEDILPDLDVGIVYLDPPYMKRQYAANYHVLETLVRGDEPDAFGISGLRDWWGQHSAFCTKTHFWDSMTPILRLPTAEHILMSYSSDGLIALDEIVGRFRAHGRVQVFQTELPRFRSNASRLGPVVTEYVVALSRT